MKSTSTSFDRQFMESVLAEKAKTVNISKKTERTVGIATANFFGIFKKIFPSAVIIEDYSVANKFDLVIFTGGEDVNPEMYGEKNSASYCNPGRDKIERAIYEAISGRRKNKIYGTCRGHQFLNVMQGGSLFQDFPSAINGYSGKPFGSHPSEHKIEFITSNDSVIKKFFQGEKVVSMHHQAVNSIGGGFYPVCVFNGIIEGMESSDGRIVTTQFHPEFNWKPDPENASNKFFKFLISEW